MKNATLTLEIEKKNLKKVDIQKELSKNISQRFNNNILTPKQ